MTISDRTAPTARPRLLVLGGGGFIGRHIVARARALSWDVASLSLRKRPDAPVAGIRVVTADASDASALREALQNAVFEYVVNCSGYIDHSAYLHGGRRVLESHLNTVLNLAETLQRDALRGFVNLGSSDEYGGNGAPQRENQRECAISPYSLAKSAAAHFLQMLYRTERFPATTLRLFLTYGPGQDPRRLVPQLIMGCLEGRAFPVSAGEQLRDFCYVQDTVDAVFAALAAPAAHGEVINVASGRPVRIRHVIELVQGLVGRGEPQFGKVSYRPGENMELYADISKARSLLGWTPRVSLEDGLAETIDWYRERC